MEDITPIAYGTPQQDRITAFLHFGAAIVDKANAFIHSHLAVTIFPHRLHELQAAGKVLGIQGALDLLAWSYSDFVSGLQVQNLWEMGNFLNAVQLYTGTPWYQGDRLRESPNSAPYIPGQIYSYLVDPGPDSAQLRTKS